MNLHSHFSLLAKYNVWATERLLSAVGQLSDEAYRRDLGLFFKSIHGTLNHLLVGEHLLWRERFMSGVSPRVALDVEVETDRMQLSQRLLVGAKTWAPWIAKLPSQRLEESLHYVSMRGTEQELPFADTLIHVFNHGTHHRGQITAALTMLGQPCPELDMVYMLQEETKH
jgi:uncharacterized damage-inducible protein DinB